LKLSAIVKERIVRSRTTLFTAIFVVGALAQLAGCSSSDSADFWREPRVYELRLAEGRGTNNIDSVSRDQVTVVLHIQRTTLDSVYGTYEGDLRPLGLMVGRATPGPQLIEGSIKGSDFRLELSPDATDAGLLLVGHLSNSTGRGSWHAESAQQQGTFQLLKR
jgi:hypothetical protein